MITTTQTILLVLVKDFSVVHTATSLAMQLKMSRWGVWKMLKKLEQEEIIIIKPTGVGRTSTQTIHLNWDNKLTEKIIILALAQEALAFKRWRFNFVDLEKEVNFLLLYGSILHTPQTAGDIDILSVANEKHLSKISKLIFIIQKTQEKKIHFYNFTAKEFVQELKKPNKLFLNALKRGIIIFGQEKFVELMKRLEK